jgi:hypothetical protein
MNPRLYNIQAQAVHMNDIDKKEALAHGRLFTPNNSRVTSVVSRSIAIVHYEVKDEMRLAEFKEPAIPEPTSKCCVVM